MTDGAVFTRDAPSPGDWADEVLVCGDDGDTCRWPAGPAGRPGLWRLVTQREKEPAAAGLLTGGTVTWQVAPLPGGIAAQLAAPRAPATPAPARARAE